MSNSEARQQALAVYDGFRLEATSLISYQSGLQVIAIGDTDALDCCDQLPQALTVERIERDGRRLEIDGYLGAFSVTVTDAQGNQSLHRGDAILDLQDDPQLAREMPPPGYFHAPAGRWDELGICDELENLGGEFEKPKYFDYDPSICAHGVNGKIACRQCIDACPAEAIHSLGELIEVNPYLCQGGGSCTSVCPSGAIRYLYPTLRDNGRRLRDMLAAYLEQGGQRPIIAFHAEVFSAQTYLREHDNLIPLVVEELASVGMDLCLSALAYGASQVVLLVDDDVPRSSRDNLEQQVDWLQSLLAGLGLDPTCVSLCPVNRDIATIAAREPIEAAVYDTPPGKRKAIFQALDHLTSKLLPSLEPLALPPPAPFGEVIIDAGKCTLCMACVGACPGRALQDGSNREVPEVFFIEANCLQCGACVQTCPEDAMKLAPRMLFDHETRNRARELNRDSPFACIGCGKAFAPTSVIHKMQDKLKDHPMFGNQRALDRLKMCDDCRAVDALQDPDAMGGQFNPLKSFKE